MFPSRPFNASDSGLLLVFMEPGPDVSLSEFHEWYDNEHVPLRTERFATFRSAARYQTVSSIFPSNTVSSSAVRNSGWGAYYTVSSNDVFAHASYTDLRSQRSQREAELFTRLAVVDRRIYRLCYDSHADARIHLTPKDGLAPQTKLHVEQHSNTIVAHSVTPANTDEYADWFDNEHALLLSKTPGWTRTRRFQLIDNGVNGTHASPEDAKQIPKFLGLHGMFSQPLPFSEST